MRQFTAFLTWRRLVRCVAFVLGASLCAAGHAQQFPAKPVRLVVGFPPGGLADIASRALAEQLTLLWKQQVIVDNRAGASGAIAGEMVARANPDGYTLLAIMPDHVILPVVVPNLPFDPLKDFSAVSLLGISPLMLLANPKLPVHSIQDLVALAKAKPGTLTYSTPGNASMHHLSQESLDSILGIKLIHVPYKGGGPALVDAIGGVVNLTLGSAAQALQQVRAGKIRPLIVYADKRLLLLPNVPTASETVAPGFSAGLWVGVLAPRDTPKALVDRINTDINRVFQTPQIQKRMSEMGVNIIDETPDRFAEYLKQESVRWAEVAHRANVTGE